MNLTSKLRSRIIFVALALALLLSVLFLPSTGGLSGRSVVAAASGHYRYSTEYTYYSDASLTVEVGSRYINCAGHATTSGTVTQYYTSEIIDICCGSVPC